MTDAAISGKFYHDGAYRELTVGVTDGIITHVGKEVKADVHYTVEGAIFPGGTDTHVHFRDPGETEKEDFSTGSMAAVYGGTTTVLDMPNNRIPVTDYSRFDDKAASIRGRSYCDYGFHSLFTGKNADLISGRSSGVKIYLGGSTNSTGLGETDQGQWDRLAERGFRTVFHAESEACLKRNRKEVDTLQGHNAVRPEECEKEGVEFVAGLKYPRKTVTHLSSMSSLSDVKKRDFLLEVTPHHLLLNERVDAGPKGKVNPPLRSWETQDTLLDTYLKGGIDIVSSDHAPHTEYDKEDFRYAKSGIIGVETRIPLLLALVRKRILPVETFYRTTIANPAASFGIRKGRVEVGYMADFFSVKFPEMKRINENRLHSKNAFSPFDGFDAVFPDRVFIRGSPSLENGEILHEKQGKFLKDLEEAQNE